MRPSQIAHSTWATAEKVAVSAGWLCICVQSICPSIKHADRLRYANLCNPTPSYKFLSNLHMSTKIWTANSYSRWTWIFMLHNSHHPKGRRAGRRAGTAAHLATWFPIYPALERKYHLTASNLTEQLVSCPPRCDSPQWYRCQSASANLVTASQRTEREKDRKKEMEALQ